MLQAICPSCHAIKTQQEAIERADEADASRRLEAARARAEFEKMVRAEEVSRQGVRTLEAGLRECTLCTTRYYPLFVHRCRVVEENIQERLDPPRKKRATVSRLSRHEPPGVTNPTDNPFMHFTFFKY
jgi:hypothetical protein